MTNEEIFDQWCPTSSRWATWAKPVLFTYLVPAEQPESLRGEWGKQDISWAKHHGNDTAVVIDLPGTNALLVALALTKAGYQPVPLFNCCAAPDHEILPTGELRDYLVRGAIDLQSMPQSSTAPPAFILDSDRLIGKNVPHPGKFDNRWMTFPQDFPSGTFLKEAGISNVILVHTGRKQPALDLAQTLMRWQESGIGMAVVDMACPRPPEIITVTPPPKYRWFFQRTLSILGFMRNSAGGFGSVIPDHSGGAG